MEDMRFGSERSSRSSGCESGWTVYLEHSYSHNNNSHKNEDDFMCKFTYEIDDQEEEEDMSMVSDASSGPQHFPEEECFKFSHNTTNGKLRKKMIPESSSLQNKKAPFLDDTATSPFFNLSNNNLTNKAHVPENDIIDYSQQGYSTTYYYKKKSAAAFEDHHLGFFHPPAAAGAQLQQNQWLQGKRRPGMN